jgi:uncharacterized protein YjbI with pentapeptide repeats
MLLSQLFFRGNDEGFQEMTEIRKSYGLGIICCSGNDSIKNLAENNKANLNEANLSGANLSGANLGEANLNEANLNEANLNEANLSGANLSEANLGEANLWRANLWRANLWRANLGEANLNEANLNEANLNEANLNEANLNEANLSGANLSGANIEFPVFPSIRLLSSISLGALPDYLTVELMRRDASSHPYRERFDEWAEGGQCPYQNEERFWFFEEKRDLWKPGKPTMEDCDLIIAICKAKGWKINGFEI